MAFEDLAAHIAEIFGADHWRMAAAVERWCFRQREYHGDYMRDYRRRPEVRRARREYDRQPERKQKTKAQRRARRLRLNAEIAAIRAAAPRWQPAPPAPFTPKAITR